MKRPLLALIVIGLAVVNANAITYTYVDVESFKTGTFNITNVLGISTNPLDVSFGYNPAAQTVYDAYAEFSFLGLGGPVQISLGGLTFGKTIGFPGGLSGSSLDNLALLDLRSDGKVSYTVQTSLTLVSGKLTVHAGSRVPDGGFTLTLLGLSVLAILVFRRKFASAM